MTPYTTLNQWHIDRLCEISCEIYGVILRTPMTQQQLEKWTVKLLANGFPKSKVIVHTDVQLARKLNIPNVHFREGDWRAAQLKKEEGKDFQVSMSTHSVNQVREAQAQQLDFVLFSHLFTTASKPDLPPRTPSEIDAVLSLDFPVVALGGITVETVQQVSSRFAGIACLSCAFSSDKQVFKQMIKQWFLKKVN